MHTHTYNAELIVALCSPELKMFLKDLLPIILHEGNPLITMPAFIVRTPLDLLQPRFLTLCK